MISLSNYEEWFILYMDEELDAEQKRMVESFLLLHPHLQEELDLLLSTKLPAEDICFSGKEELQAAAMKLNTVDESLLLYIDNELPAAEQKAVEEKMAASQDFRLQYDLLRSTKLDAAEIIPYPNKKELYRHTEKLVSFPVWMRVAVAVIMLLFGSYLFLFNPDSPTVTTNAVVVQNTPDIPGTSPSRSGDKDVAKSTDAAREAALADPRPENKLARIDANKKANKSQEKESEASPVNQNTREAMAAVAPQEEAMAVQKTDAIKVDLSKVNAQSLTAVNNSVAKLPVTSLSLTSLNSTETPEEPAVTEGENNGRRTPAKGFLRKVSRFIERRTGIGTVNADNELLVGAVALKLN